MWRELIVGLYEDAVFTEPLPGPQIDEMSSRVGQVVPGDLRALLQETDGVRSRRHDPVWSTQEIIEQNLEFRGNQDFAELYMSFDQLLFFADNGGGDQFGFVCVPYGRDKIFVWDHETDSRYWVAGSLTDYLNRRAHGHGDDWYR